MHSDSEEHLVNWMQTGGQAAAVLYKFPPPLLSLALGNLN